MGIRNAREWSIESAPSKPSRTPQAPMEHGAGSQNQSGSRKIHVQPTHQWTVELCAQWMISYLPMPPNSEASAASFRRTPDGQKQHVAFDLYGFWQKLVILILYCSTGLPRVKSIKVLAVLPLTLLTVACEMGAESPSASDKKIKEICAQYKTEQITKDEALDRLGLGDEVQANTVDGSIDTDELIYDLCDPEASRDRGDVEDGV